MATIDFPVQIALLDDHPLFRRGLRYILQALPYVEAVVEAGDLPALLALCRQRQPDVLLLDMQMPGVDGQEAARVLLSEFPSLRIIVLSMFAADKFIVQMMKAGARSYLPKDADEEQLRQALEEVLTTGHHFTPNISRALMRGVQQPAAEADLQVFGPVHLTPREYEVLQLISEGRSAPEIATLLNLSTRTIEGHWQRMLDKTGAANSAGLVAYAARHDLLQAKPSYLF